MLSSTTPTATGALEEATMPEDQDPTEEKAKETGAPFEFNQYHPGGVIRQLVEALGLQQQTPPTEPEPPTE
jgi:hypothetical protein